MERGMRKVVVVTMRTRLEELKIRYNTTEQAKFYIEHMGQAFDDYIAEDEKYREAVKAVSMAAEKDCRLQIIDRSFVPNMIFGVDDIVVCVHILIIMKKKKKKRRIDSKYHEVSGQAAADRYQPRPRKMGWCAASL